MQCVVAPGAWIRSRYRIGGWHPEEVSVCGRACGTYYRIHDRFGFLRPRNGREQPGHAGTDCLGGILWWSRHSGAVTEQRSAALVPGKWSESGPADDVDEHRALQ